MGSYSFTEIVAISLVAIPVPFLINLLVLGKREGWKAAWHGLFEAVGIIIVAVHVPLVLLAMVADYLIGRF